MSQTNKIYADTIGTVVVLDTKVDISTATKASIKVLKPDGTVTEWIGSVVTPGNTSITYTTQGTDLSAVGVYKLQAYVETPIWTGRGDTVQMEVKQAFG
jgi:hypothetical protein